MAKSSTLLALIEAESEPTPRSYNETVDDTIRNPQQISGLTQDSVRDDVLIHLTTRSHRLANFFSRLGSTVRKNPKVPFTINIAAETVDFLVGILPYAHKLLEPTKVLDFLIPALDICFAPSQRPALRELASIIAEAGSLLEYISSDRLGSDILRQWACTSNSLAIDAQTLETWTQRSLKMVVSCRKNHDVAQAIQQWSNLKSLKTSLQSMRDTHARKSKDGSESTARQKLLPLRQMTQLSKEDKKARTTKGQNLNTSLPNLPDHIQGFLKAFDLPIPGSVNLLQEVIKRLEGDETTAVLRSIATSFPCNLCILGIESLQENPGPETDKQSIEAVSNPKIEILDKDIRIWEVLLSQQALRSLLHMGSYG